MSFWSFLGLADRSDMNALAEEVRLLREENSRLLSEQKLRAQQQIHDLKTDNQRIMQDHVDFLTQCIQKHRATSSQEMEACCTLLVQEIRKLREESRDLIRTQEATLQSGLQALNGTSQRVDEQIDHFSALMAQYTLLFQNQSQIMDYLARLCQNSDQFLDIQNSINHMWEIMKVVWVDSLLQHLEGNE